jgi:ribosomal protein L12E/L44/L45/RPP1/RPP2
MRTFITAMAIALLAVAAPAQAIAKGKRQQQDAPKAEDQAKKKASDEAYKNALKSIPESKEKMDPWKSVR